MKSKQTYTHRAIVGMVREKAIGLRPAPDHQHAALDWIPKSQIIAADCDIDDAEVGDEVEIEIPLWLAVEKGLTEER